MDLDGNNGWRWRSVGAEPCLVFGDANDDDLQ